MRAAGTRYRLNKYVIRATACFKSYIRYWMTNAGGAAQGKRITRSNRQRRAGAGNDFGLAFQIFTAHLAVILRFGNINIAN